VWWRVGCRIRTEGGVDLSALRRHELKLKSRVDGNDVKQASVIDVGLFHCWCRWAVRFVAWRRIDPSKADRKAVYHNIIT
jgi:hypothetical protein